MTAAAQPDAPETRPPRGPKKRPSIAWWILPLAGLGLLGLVALFGYAVIFARYSADGPSMEPALPSGAGFFVVRRTWAGDPEPGEIIVLRTREGLEVIKRVVAVGGQSVSLRDDLLVVDDRVISESTECPPGAAADDEETVCRRERLGAHEWSTVQSSYSTPESNAPFAVPAGHVYVLGDHRDRSNDSRNPRLGAIPLDAIVGTVVAD